jgi:S-(hydroxymethyl)glutathione dehydrogenase / alcohol dehydrogenase
MKTRAAVLVETGKPLQVEELTLPTLKSGQVLVKIAYSGVCHTQLNEVKGLKGEDRFLPHTLGHEGAGTVESIGPDVTKVKEGDSVVLTWIKGKGLDVPSVSYWRDDGSTVNSGAISTFMERAVISENRLVPVSIESSLRELPLLGCAIPTGAGIAINTAKVQPESTVAIFGVGGIGLSAIIGCNLQKAKTIIAIDVFDHKLELAMKVGATHKLNGNNVDVLATILEITNQKGVDFSIEASGKAKIMETAFQSVSNSGGLCVIAGNLPEGERISLDPFDLIKGKKIVGTWGGGTHPDKDITMYADLLRTGNLELDPLITNVYSLSEINMALDDLNAGKLGRGLIKL